jgi:hypothetical protein
VKLILKRIETQQNSSERRLFLGQEFVLRSQSNFLYGSDRNLRALRCPSNFNAFTSENLEVDAVPADSLILFLFARFECCDL